LSLEALCSGVHLFGFFLPQIDVDEQGCWLIRKGGSGNLIPELGQDGFGIGPSTVFKCGLRFVPFRFFLIVRPCHGREKRQSPSHSA